MKRILLIALLFSLMVCVASTAWAGALDDVKAGENAFYAGNCDEAIRLYTKAIESGELSRVRLREAYCDRGYTWWFCKGDYDKAIADYTKAIEIDPNPKYAAAYDSLAWLMATCPIDKYRDGKRAVDLAEKALKSRETAARLDILAAAYAEVGRFREAVKTEERAIAKLTKEGNTKPIAEFEKHLASYKAGKPWREKQK